MRNQDFTSASQLPFKIRPARVFAALRIIIAIILVLALAVVGLAALDNALAPPIQLTRAAGGPPDLTPVRAFAINDKTGTLFAGSESGLYRSTDGGQTWQLSSNGFPSIDVQALLFDNSKGILYAALFKGQIYSSSDDGLTWQFASRGLRSQELLTLTQDKSTGELFAGTNAYGLFTSVDGGASWQVGYSGLSNMRVSQLLPGQKPNLLYAATSTGVYSNTDLSQQWQALTDDIPGVDATSLVLDEHTGVLYAGTNQGVLKFTPDATSPAGLKANGAGLADQQIQTLYLDAQSGVLYAGTLGGGVYQSINAGADWSPANTGLEGGIVRSILLDLHTQTLLAGTDNGIYLSRNSASDGAATWKAATVTPNSQHILSLLVDSTAGAVYAGSVGGGVFRSTDRGAHWQSANIGLSNSLVQALAVDHGVSTLMAGTQNGLFRAPTGDIRWATSATPLKSASIEEFAVDERAGIVYMVNTNGDTFRSSDGGSTWKIIDPLQPIFARTVAVSSYSNAVYVGAYKAGVWMSTDRGLSWRPIGSGLPDKNVEALRIDERSGTVYAGTQNGTVYRSSNGTSWQKMGSSLPSALLTLLVDERNGALYATVNTGVFRLRESETSWAPITTGLPNTLIYSLDIDPQDGTLYVGTLGAGVFRSDDGGDNWQAASAGLTDAQFDNVVAVDASGELYATVRARGVYHSTDNGATWRPANVGLSDLNVTGIALDEGSGSLELLTTSGECELQPGASGWQPRATSPANWPGLLLPTSAFGFVGRLPGGDLVWIARGGGQTWTRLSAALGVVKGTIRLLPGGQGQVYTVWGSELAQSQPGAGYGRVPLAWLFVRAGVWKAGTWVALNAPWWWAVLLAIVVLGMLVFVIGRLRTAHVAGVPARPAVLLPGWKVPDTAIEKVWPTWERTIRGELYRYGEVTPPDIGSIPSPMRIYALRRYAQMFEERQALALMGKRLRLAGDSRLARRWVAAALAISASLRRQRFSWVRRDRTDDLAEVLAEALHLQLQPARDVGSVRGYVAAAQAAAQPPLPARLAVLFVADSEPSVRTARALASAATAFGVDPATGNSTGVVIPLGTPGRQTDAANRLRGILRQDEEAQHLVVLSSDDVLDVLISKNSAQSFMSYIAPETKAEA